MAVVRKKQDDKNLKILRELVTTGGGNRQCFDCGQKGPTYVNMTIGSFVCTRCSGVLRGLTPPHRVKSISMATFTPEEIEFLKSHGNDVCAKTWLGLWDPKRVIHQDQRELMIDKYERKRYYLEPASPLKSLTNATTTTTSSVSLSTSKLSNISNGSNNSHNSSSTSINNINNINHHHSNNINGSIKNSSLKNNSNNNNKNNNINNNNNITLTSPSFVRVTANGILGGGGSINGINGNCGGSGGGGGGIGRGDSGGGITTIPTTLNLINGLNSHNSLQNNRFNFQNNFISNENNNNNIINGLHNNSGSNALMNGFNGIGNNSSSTTASIVNNHVMINKNSLNALPTIPAPSATTTTAASSSITKNSNGFTPDSDFVADFGSANIFNATTASTAKKTTVNPLNGFKIQSQQNHIQNNGISNTIKSPINGLQQHQYQNGFITTSAINGNTTQNSTNHTDTINANENFADFDHAPIIYNAAAAYQLNYNSNNNNQNNYNFKNNFLTMNTTNNNLNSFNQTVQQTPFSNCNVFNATTTNFTNYNENNNNNSNNFINNFTNNDISNIQYENNGVNINNTIIPNICSSNNMINNNNNNNFSCITTTNGGGSVGGVGINNNNNNNKNQNHYANINAMQWNLWQQFQSQWPLSYSSSTSSTSFTSQSSTPSSISNNNNEENNGWSLPMSNSTSNSSATFNSNSTPPADRYAALKDLDEQLRESKAAAAAAAAVAAVGVDTTFSSSVQVSQSSVNPFKTTQPPPPTQSQQIVNPFQTTFNQTNNNNNIFVTPSSSQQIATANVCFNTGTTVFGGNTVQPTSTVTASGFNNGYITQSTALVTNNLNGCNGGLHYGTPSALTVPSQQQISAGSSLTNLKNPFATSSLNSNNPFL